MCDGLGKRVGRDSGEQPKKNLVPTKVFLPITYFDICSVR